MTENGVATRVQKLSQIEASMQTFLGQKQQLQTQLFELESALGELEKTTSAYKIIGSIMVATPKEDLHADLVQKKEIAELRIKSIEKQEEHLRTKAKSIQEEVYKK